MPTNDERREVAARLREIDVKNWCIGDFVVSDLEEACGCGYSQPFAHMDINKRLADLIEPEPAFGLYAAFPYIFWTKRNPMEDIADRIDKLYEEAQEVLEVNDEAELLSETLDVIHCCVEILRKYDPETIEKAVIEHNAKNSERGYYKPKVVK